MIRAIGLTKRYGRFLAVRGLDFDVPRGQVTGLLGPNGAGKSTTIRMIVGSLTPSAGTLIVNGFDVVEQGRQARAAIGYLPENTPLYEEMRVVEYLRYRGRLFGMRRRDRRDSVDHVLRRCWLTDVRRQTIGTLSKGYRQRVGLAAAMLHAPPVLVLDEPTTGLDPSQIRETRSLIRELAGEHTVLLSSHILPEVERTCDRIIMVARGEIRAEGDVAELRNRSAARSPYEIETEQDGAASALRMVAGVERVEAEDLGDGFTRVLVYARADQPDLRESLARALARGTGVTRALRRCDASLEQLFVEVMTNDEAMISDQTPRTPTPTAPQSDAPTDTNEPVEAQA